MKITTHALLPLLCAATVGLSAADAPGLTDAKQKVSYALGVNMGNSLRRIGAGTNDIDADLLLQGLKAAQADREAAEAVRAAGTHLLAAETGILAQLPQLLEQVLHVE